MALTAETPNPLASPPTVIARRADLEIHRIVGILFDEKQPPRMTSDEAVSVDGADCLKRVAVAFRVRDESALPLALNGQIVLGGPSISASELKAYERKAVAIATNDGKQIFKRVGPSLGGKLKHVRQFESIGGLGQSLLIATEDVEDSVAPFPVMVSARAVLGVLYKD